MAADNVSAKRIAVEGLKPGMVFARDLVDISGNVLIKKGSMLNRDNYNLIILSSNPYAFVLESSVFPEQPGFFEFQGGSPHTPATGIPVRERSEFIRFQQNYESKSESLQSELSSITEKNSVNQDRLFAIASDLMDKMEIKTDVFLYLNSLVAKDEPAYAHSVNVALLCYLFGIWTDANDEELYTLTNAALLHDIGKTQLPGQLLKTREADLSQKDREEMRKHSVLGYRILDGMDLPQVIKTTALSHHERIDGSGYPLGMKGGKLIDYAKIVAICDTYDAMTSEWFRETRLSPFGALRSFERGSYNKLDASVLMTFLENIAYTFTNSRVLLSDNTQGTVAFIHKGDLSRPLIKTSDGKIIDLKTKKDLYITSVY